MPQHPRATPCFLLLVWLYTHFITCNVRWCAVCTQHWFPFKFQGIIFLGILAFLFARIWLIGKEHRNKQNVALICCNTNSCPRNIHALLLAFYFSYDFLLTSLLAMWDDMQSAVLHWFSLKFQGIIRVCAFLLAQIWHNWQKAQKSANVN